MIKKTGPIFFIMAFFGLSLTAQTITPEEYIATYKDIAMREMKRMGVPAAITLAQGILESENGNSVLVKKSNNHFGIKCKSNWTAGGVSHDDDAIGECFRTYPTAEDSYRDHSNFLRSGSHYSFLFRLNPTDYKGWAYGLKKAGYATNPKYPIILIKNIEKYNLQQYSLEAADGVPHFESSKYTDDTEVVEINQEDDKSVSTPDRSNLPPSLPVYPDKVSFINGSKCIYALKGASLLAIATRHDINLQKLLNINELEEDGILEEDQLIFLQKKSKTGERDFIITQRKTSLYEVAQSNGVLLESLLAYNQLNEDGDVPANTRLYLKPVAEAYQAKIIMEKADSLRPMMHEVQPKEGLYTVAKKYGVTVKQLKEWNNLSSDDLKIGQQLIINK